MANTPATIAAAGGRTCISVNPATGEEIGAYSIHGAEAQDVILEAAWQAWHHWREVPIAERSAMLARLAAGLRAASENLGRLITQEMGKPISAARAEVEKCAALCTWYAANAERLLADEPADVGGDGQARIAYLPIGPVLGVMPWNFPLWQILRAAVPIIVAGNSFVLKHADNVQGSAFALADILRAAALPDGVFSILTIHPADLPAVIADRRIAAVTVTAGVVAGASIAAEAGRNLKKSLLELGGSDAFIVLADADLDRAVAVAIESRFQNTGQVCVAAKRIIVEKPIAEAFIARFVEGAKALRQGDPLDASTKLGPLARPRLRQELHKQVENSIAEGARLLLGGAIPEGRGCFYPATVLTDVSPGMTVFREETFGPVAAIIVADDVEHAVRLANDSDYGLSASLWTADPEAAAQLARRIETGAVFINAMTVSDPRVPIGGIRKSGYGRELSYFGLREFCNAQLVWARA